MMHGPTHIKIAITVFELCSGWQQNGLNGVGKVIISAKELSLYHESS